MKKGKENLNGLEGEKHMGLGLGNKAIAESGHLIGGSSSKMDLGLGKKVGAEGGSNVGGSPSNMGHNISVQDVDKTGKFVASPQVTTLDNNKHTAMRIVPQKEPNLSGPIDTDIPKERDYFAEVRGSGKNS